MQKSPAEANPGQNAKISCRSKTRSKVMPRAPEEAKPGQSACPDKIMEKLVLNSGDGKRWSNFASLSAGVSVQDYPKKPGTFDKRY